MSYLISAYAVVLLSLGLYAVHLRLRGRRLRDQISGPPPGSSGPGPGAVDKRP